jgi:formylglycine-generating enzyme required for sulfatase activity
MNDRPQPPLTPPLEAARRIHQKCEQFEDAWNGPVRPQLGTFLSDVEEPERSWLLTELLALELELRQAAGEQPTEADYLQTFPDESDRDVIAAAFRRCADCESEATDVRPDSSTRAPTAPRIEGYDILDVLGRGGMGVVYKARHLALNRIVALKMILADGQAGPHDLARFRIEAEAAARLQHANIVQIHEVGEADGHPYCALEFVEGGNLTRKLHGKPVPAREAARLVEALARAMQLAHSRNVVHRDLKPANILLAADGTPKITDFGLARQLDRDSGETQAGAVMGTPSYMAPEQASGLAHEAGPSADVYALGAVLYECLAGRPPFKGSTVVQTLDQVRTQEPLPPSRVARSGDHATTVPLDLDTICLKCLRKEPEKRYASAAELADELVRYQHGEPILARPVGRVERAGKWVKRNPVVTPVAAALVLVTVLGVAGIVWKYADAEEQWGIAEDQKNVAEKQRGLAENQKNIAEKQKILAQGKEKAALYEADKARQARDFLVRIFERADATGPQGTMTARQILDDAEKEIPIKFAGQPELQAELLAAIDTVYAKLTANSPLAMILEVSGTVQLQSVRNPKQQAVPQTLLHAGDRLTLAADGQVRLVFLSDLHQERLRPGREAGIRRKGCEPPDAVLERIDDIMMTFVRLPKGTFYMGWGTDLVEKKMQPATKTEIKEDFEIAVHDVTQGQWQAVMGENPSHYSRLGGGRLEIKHISDEELKLFPVDSVSWEDAQQFLKKLNEKERGRGYMNRLPTDAEWEYACRNGATSEKECSYFYYFAEPTNLIFTELANFNGNHLFNKGGKQQSMVRPTRVGAYPPNKLGLCDMHGNMYQWCADPWIGSPGGRVVRGSNWRRADYECQAAARTWTPPTMRAPDLSFRPVRVPVP